MKDYFQILGLPPNASEAEIKTAYRKLSKKFHPDLNNQDLYFEKFFKEINEAYEVLSDPYKKQQYLLLNQNNYSKNNFALEQSYQDSLIELKRKEQIILNQKGDIRDLEATLQDYKHFYVVFWISVIAFAFILTLSIYIVNNLSPQSLEKKEEIAKERQNLAELKKSSNKVPEPPNGVEGFYRYINSKMIYPPEAIENNIEGDVILELTVDTNGVLKNPKVVKSLGYGCDEEAIRLIENAPPWHPAYQYGEKMEMKILFPIPFKLNP